MKLQVKTQANSSWRVCSEALALQRVMHPFIVRLECAFQTPKFFALMLELCPGGDLNRVVCRAQDEEGKLHGLKPELVARYMGQILLALTHLHKEKLVYRDMKPANVLLAENDVAKLSDFGTVSFVGRGTSRSRCMSLVGTQGFLAPELIYGDDDDSLSGEEEQSRNTIASEYFLTDSYSFGVSLAILLLGTGASFADVVLDEDDSESLLPNGGSEEQQLSRLQAALESSLLSAIAFDLLTSLLRHKPRHRKKLSDSEVIGHPFFLETLQCRDLEDFLIRNCQ